MYYLLLLWYIYIYINYYFPHNYYNFLNDRFTKTKLALCQGGALGPDSKRQRVTADAETARKVGRVGLQDMEDGDFFFPCQNLWFPHSNIPFSIENHGIWLRELISIS